MLIWNINSHFQICIKIVILVFIRKRNKILFTLELNIFPVCTQSNVFRGLQNNLFYLRLFCYPYSLLFCRISSTASAKINYRKEKNKDGQRIPGVSVDKVSQAPKSFIIMDLASAFKHSAGNSNTGNIFSFFGKHL